GYFGFDMFRIHNDPWLGQIYEQKMISFGAAHVWFMLLAAGYTVSTMVRRRPSLPAMYWVLAMAMTFTAGKSGANGNQFLEPVAATVLCAGLGVWALRARVRMAWVAWPATAVTVYLLAQFILVAQPYNDPAYHVADCGAVYGAV